MNPVSRFTDACLARAARRWPAGLAETMAREWQAELAALRTDPARSALARAWSSITFAASLALCRPVEAEACGTTVSPWRRLGGRASVAATALSGSAAVAMFAAALVNLGHALSDAVRPDSAATGGLIVLAVVTGSAATMASAGHLAAARSPVRARAAMLLTVAIGASMYAFFLAGNRFAVMPYMGWRDIGPAILTWVALMTAAIGAAVRLAAAGRRRAAVLAGTAGALITADVTAVAGSLHAATGLGLGLGPAPAWLPLSLLPGGTVRIGHFFTGRPATVGGIHVSGPPFYASDILMAHVSTIAGPLLLCSAFLITYAVRVAAVPVRIPAAPVSAASVPSASVPVASVPIASASSAVYASGILARRALVAIAIGFAVLTPMGAHLASPTLRSGGLALIPWFIAVTAASAGRRIPLRYPVLGAVFIVSATALSALLTIAPLRDGAGAGLAAGPLAVTVLAIAMGDESGAHPRRVVAWLAAGAGSVTLSLPVAGALAQGRDIATTTLTRMEANSNVFGFGFVSQLAGQLLLAAAVAIIGARIAVAAEPAVGVPVSGVPGGGTPGPSAPNAGAPDGGAPDGGAPCRRS